MTTSQETAAAHSSASFADFDVAAGHGGAVLSAIRDVVVDVPLDGVGVVTGRAGVPNGSARRGGAGDGAGDREGASDHSGDAGRGGQQHGDQPGDSGGAAACAPPGSKPA